MPKQDYFPEDGYDPTSGEYSNQFDFEPTFSTRVYLNFEKSVWADIGTEPNFEPYGEHVKDLLQELAGKGYFDPDFTDKNPYGFPTIPFEFDYGDKNVRGPFIGSDAVQRFLKQSGLKGIAIVYYDEQQDEFWIDVNTN